MKSLNINQFNPSPFTGWALATDLSQHELSSINVDALTEVAPDNFKRRDCVLMTIGDWTNGEIQFLMKTISNVGHLHFEANGDVRDIGFKLTTPYFCQLLFVKETGLLGQADSACTMKFKNDCVSILLHKKYDFRQLVRQNLSVPIVLIGLDTADNAVYSMWFPFCNKMYSPALLLNLKSGR